MRTAVCTGLLVAALVAGGCVRATSGAHESSAVDRADDGKATADAEPGNPRDDLIPRAVLFGNPEHVGVLVSPDGKWISWHAPHEGVVNVWVAPANDLAHARPVTAARSQPIWSAQWTFDGKHLVYLQDDAGDENFHVFRVDVDTGETVDLTPIEGVRAEQIWLSHRKPDTMLVALNERDASVFDVHAIDLASGVRRLVARNDGSFVSWIVDHDLAVRFAEKMADDGTLVRMVKRGRAWRHHDDTPPEDLFNTSVLGFDATGKSYYVFDSRGRDTSALFLVDAKAKRKRLVYAHERADLHSANHPWPVLVHPTEMTVQAVVVDYEKPR